jgi:hypothetical protein
MDIQGNFDLVDLRVGDRDEKYSQFVTSLDKAIDRLTKKVATEYGNGLGTLSAGVISLDFQQKGTDTFDEDA